MQLCVRGAAVLPIFKTSAKNGFITIFGRCIYPNKPTFRHTWRHIRVWPSYLYLAGLQDQPPAASKWPDIILDKRIEILTQTNLHLDNYEGILEIDQLSVPGQPPGSASSGPSIMVLISIISSKILPGP